MSKKDKLTKDQRTLFFQICRKPGKVVIAPNIQHTARDKALTVLQQRKLVTMSGNFRGQILFSPTPEGRKQFLQSVVTLNSVEYTKKGSIYLVKHEDVGVFGGVKKAKNKWVWNRDANSKTDWSTAYDTRSAATQQLISDLYSR